MSLHRTISLVLVVAALLLAGCATVAPTADSGGAAADAYSRFLDVLRESHSIL